jgi:uncharacterized protein YgiM (DUF1202 family)
VEPEHPADEPLLADEPPEGESRADEPPDEEPLDERVEREIARRAARYQRWRRKRRRHILAFWLLFLLLVVGGIAAAFALAGGSDQGSARPPITTTTAASDLPDIPPAKLYKVTDGVNIRSGPGTTYRTVGTVETGFEVLVICQIEGQAVTGPVGPSTKWLYILYNGINGYVTAQYVAVGPAINDPTVIGECPPL